MAGEKDTGQERTESPTQRRKDDARNEGKVAKTQDASGAAVVLTGALLLAGFAGTAFSRCAFETLATCAGALRQGAMGGDSAFGLARHVLSGFALAMLPFVGGVAFVGVGAQVAQTKGAISTKPLTPDLSRILPTAGIKRMFSAETLVHMGLALVKAAVVGGVAWSTLSHHVPDLLSLADLAPAQIALVMRDLLVRLALATGVVYGVLAAIDYGFMRFRHEQSLRMTRQEIVMEHRETDGDPLVKARMRQIARAKARQRMLGDVATADVVIVNPIHIAVALRYDPAKAPAPVVLALGERLMAEKIKALARKNNVPIIENIPVAHALKASATVGKMIPAALYTVIAEILAFVYRQKNALPRVA